MDGKSIRFYGCGPTVYGPAHIGNFRTFVMQDVFRRVLETSGQKLTMFEISPMWMIKPFVNPKRKELACRNLLPGGRSLSRGLQGIESIASPH